MNKRFSLVLAFFLVLFSIDVMAIYCPLGGDPMQWSPVTVTIYGYDPEGTQDFLATDTDSGSFRYEPTCSFPEAFTEFTAFPNAQWGGMSTVCNIGGLEGQYRFEVVSSEGQICASEYETIDWNLDKSWCELSGCGRGDWETNTCCSAFEMYPNSPYIRYTNEDCNKIVGNDLCYFTENAKQEQPTSTGEWLDAGANRGEIVYEECGHDINSYKENGPEYLSNGLNWLKCTNSSINKQFVVVTDANGDNINHQYICINRLAPQKYSWVECAADSNSIEPGKYPGGVIASKGKSIYDSNGEVYFCNINNQWDADLDHVSVAGQDGSVCNTAYFPTKDQTSTTLSGTKIGAHWTGDYCCGEPDDYTGAYPDSANYSSDKEYYNDDDRIISNGGKHTSTASGACWNSLWQQNESFLTIPDKDGDVHEAREVMIWHGTFQGCGIDHEAALENKQDPGRVNDGYFYEEIECALPNSLNKPYEGTFKYDSKSDFGFDNSVVVSGSGDGSPDPGITGSAVGCVDSDLNDDPSILGTVTCNGVTYTDECTDFGLREYYCDGDTMRYSEYVDDISCVGKSLPSSVNLVQVSENVETNCPVSRGGVGYVPCTGNANCCDLDGGKYPYVDGGVACGIGSATVSVQFFPENCANGNTVNEYSCSGNNVIHTEYRAVSTCSGGKYTHSNIRPQFYSYPTPVDCNPSASAPTGSTAGPTDTGACTDSDSGSNLNTYGTVYCNGAAFAHDACSGGNVVEFWCSGDTVKRSVYRAYDGTTTCSGSTFPDGTTVELVEERDEYDCATGTVLSGGNGGTITGDPTPQLRGQSTFAEAETECTNIGSSLPLLSDLQANSNYVITNERMWARDFPVVCISGNRIFYDKDDPLVSGSCHPETDSLHFQCVSDLVEILVGSGEYCIDSDGAVATTKGTNTCGDYTTDDYCMGSVANGDLMMELTCSGNSKTSTIWIGSSCNDGVLTNPRLATAADFAGSIVAVPAMVTTQSCDEIMVPAGSITGNVIADDFNIYESIIEPDTNPITGFAVSTANPRGNDFMLGLKNNPNSSRNDNSGPDLIYDNEYCNIKEWSNGQSFFCSYTEQWVQDTDASNPRNHLSFIPWKNASAQQAECCRQSECWDGNQCVPSVTDTFAVTPWENNFMNSREDGFICKNGDWEWSYKKTNWDGTEEGYCMENTQCFVSQSGQYSNTDVHGPLEYAIDELSGKSIPACINNGEFYADHYCNNGTWTSRTQYVALEMYNKASDDFTLYCDTYDKVLNHFSYSVVPSDLSTVADKFFKTNPSSNCKTWGGGEIPCVNHVCVMVEDPSSDTPKISFGTSINYLIEAETTSGQPIQTYDVAEALGTSLTGCEQGIDQPDNLVSCGGTNIAFNQNKSILIFSRDGGYSSGDFGSILRGLFSNFIKTLVDSLVSSGDFTAYDYSVFELLSEDLYNATGDPITHYIPDFECNNCTNNLGDIDDDNRNEVCGEAANPRRILDLSTLYLSRVDGKEIFGLAEYESYEKGTSAERLYGVSFTGFNEDMCVAFRPQVSGYQCKNVNGKQIVAARITTPSLDISYDSLVDISSWEQFAFMGPSTRIQ
ncbi:hypothetical protein H6503_01695 [Candidatus Woesearchaeota archaeon]|nr:hypothetical protein [Candidatus Woesearchaeota archaeon]